jgi:hypothetical protein
VELNEELDHPRLGAAWIVALGAALLIMLAIAGTLVVQAFN